MPRSQSLFAAALSLCVSAALFVSAFAPADPTFFA